MQRIYSIKGTNLSSTNLAFFQIFLYTTDVSQHLQISAAQTAPQSATIMHKDTRQVNNT